jgi:methionyl-tRNA formyltransferase
VFTQNEPFFLPATLGIIARGLEGDIAFMVVASPMSSTSGRMGILWRYAGFLGLRGALITAGRILASRLGPLTGRRPRGRDHWSVAEVGGMYGIPCYRVADVNGAEIERILGRHPADLLVSVSCPQIIRSGTRKRFGAGAVNVHSGPLPRYRGLMPGFWVLHQGEKTTAVTVHDLTAGIDAGGILLQREIGIEPGETWDRLLRRTKKAAGHAVVDAVSLLRDGEVSRRPNDDERSTYFGFPTRRDVRAFRRAGGRLF